MNIGLLLIDLQNDYFSGGKNELKNPEDAARNVGKALELFRQRQWPVFHVQHLSLSSDATFFLPNTIGADIYKGCAPQPGEAVIVKHKPDSFLGTGLDDLLKKAKINQLVVGGMMTHMCVDTTVRAAAGLGYTIDLLEDTCATKDLIWRGQLIQADQVQAAYMAALSGTFARVSRAEEWLRLQ